MITQDKTPDETTDGDTGGDPKVLKPVELKSISLKDLLAKYPEKRRRRWGRPL